MYVGQLVSGLHRCRDLANRRCTGLLSYRSANALLCLRRRTERIALTRFKGKVFVHKLVRIDGQYHGGYRCYKVEGKGATVAHCTLGHRAVLRYYHRKCTLKFHAFIVRNNRSPTLASR